MYVSVCVRARACESTYVAHYLLKLGIPVGRALARGEGCAEPVLFVVWEAACRRFRLLAKHAHAVARGLVGRG